MTSKASSDRFEKVQVFVAEVKSAGTLGTISGLLSDAAREFDFDHFAMTQRYGLRIDGVPVQLHDLPDSWTEMLVDRDYWRNDPVLAACQRTVAPFAWEDLPELIELTPKQQSYMQQAADRGLSNGWTVPIHIPGEATGLCSFVLAADRALPKDSLPAAQYLACFAFEAARRLASRGEPPAPKLTRRQVECVVLAAKGKSDWVAGQILGLAPDTVHKYLEQAKARFGVSSRTELVVRALYDGQIGFSDILG
jgi:LuxR family quorum-sensing system transcriptional regulator CciR